MIISELAALQGDGRCSCRLQKPICKKRNQVESLGLLAQLSELLSLQRILAIRGANWNGDLHWDLVDFPEETSPGSSSSELPYVNKGNT